jgi:epoxyqueuosine reductase
VNAPIQAWIAVLDLLRGTDAELLAQWSPWYLAERDPRWIRRNALIVLGNVGDAADHDVQDVVRAYLGHDDPLLREHAEWAARQLGLQALAAGSSA